MLSKYSNESMFRPISWCWVFKTIHVFSSLKPWEYPPTLPLLSYVTIYTIWAAIQVPWQEDSGLELSHVCTTSCIFWNTLVHSGDESCSWLFTLGNTGENLTEEMRIHNEHHMNSQNIEKATTQEYFSLLFQRSTSQVVNNI